MATGRFRCIPISGAQMIASSFLDFSLSELIRLLCFENEEQAVNFLRAYSLKVSDTGQVSIVPWFCVRVCVRVFAPGRCRRKTESAAYAKPLR